MGRVTWAALALACGQQQEAIEQPIPFSHETHVVKREMKCLECHAGTETEQWAGLPTPDDCLRCHAFELSESPQARLVAARAPELPPDPWVRLYQLAPHAFVSHAAHTRAKVECETCHGDTGASAVARREHDMRGETLMYWCIECHEAKKVSTDCLTCHR